MSSVFVYEPQICINVIMYNFSYDTFFLSNEKEMLKNEAQTEALLLKVSNLLFPGAEVYWKSPAFFLPFFLPFQIMEYYFEERLHILQCTKFLLSYWQDPRHRWRVS